ncbi:MAG: hypothetical protein P8Y97_01320 [Candidatus Lokiarchaeota archaeon]
MEIIEKLRKTENITILFTSHNLFFVRNWADKMFVLRDGKGLYEGNPIKGLKKPEILNFLGSYQEILKVIQK